MVERGLIKPEQVKIVWTSEPLPNDALAVRKDLDPALVAKISGIVTGLTDEQAKAIMPAHYTGWMRPRTRNTSRSRMPASPWARYTRRPPNSRTRMRRLPWLLTLAAFYAACLYFAEVDPARLWSGIPRLLAWTARAWPPDFSEFPTLLRRAAETLAMATLGTTMGMLLAVPLCLSSARNTMPPSFVRAPVRSVMNVLRGIDSFVFALLFVAAVGLGPFAVVLGVGVHSAGSIAKLWSEALETSAPGPVDAALLTGASRLKVIVYALIPDVLPSLTSIILYIWEFNLRASTVLGVVGAGGIGQELKNAVDLLDFPRVFAILTVILAMVTAIDQTSAFLRRRLA